MSFFVHFNFLIFLPFVNVPVDLFFYFVALGPFYDVIHFCYSVYVLMYIFFQRYIHDYVQV